MPARDVNPKSGYAKSDPYLKFEFRVGAKTREYESIRKIRNTLDPKCKSSCLC